MFDYLVLGGSGFIGKGLLKRLSELSFSVLAVEHRTPINFENKTRASLLIDEETLKKCRKIIHLARLSSRSSLKRIIKSMYGYALNLRIAKLAEKFGNFIVYFSGSLVYGNGEHFEDSPMNPISYQRFYSWQEIPFQDLKNRAILRPGWILGDGSWFKEFYLNSMLKEGFVPLYGRGENVMSMVCIEDCIDLTIRIAEENRRGIFNVYSEYWKQRDFVEFISSISNLPIKRINLNRFNLEVYEAFNSSIYLRTKHTFEHEFKPIKDKVLEILRNYGLC